MAQLEPRPFKNGLHNFRKMIIQLAQAHLDRSGFQPLIVWQFGLLGLCPRLV